MNAATMANSRQRIRDIYNKDGRQYDEYREDNPKGRLISERDISLFERMLPNDLAGRRIVEIGAGTGRFTLPMLKRGLHLTATDINEPMLYELRQKAEAIGASEQCTIQLEDIFNLSFTDASIDFIACIHVIPRFLTLEDQQAALTEIARTLRPTGKLLFNYSNARSLNGFFYKGHAATPRQMEKMLTQAGLHVTLKCGKWLLSRTLLNKLPLALGRSVVAADIMLERLYPNGAWDIFLLAERIRG